MSRRADIQNIGTAMSLVTPARHLPKIAKVLAASIGVKIMLFDAIPKDGLYAMIIAIVLTAAAFLAINYLAEYRDWKFNKQLEYEAALNTDGKNAVKPDTAFSKIYVLSLICSLIFVSVIAAFIIPLAVKFFVYDPELAGEASTYFFIAVLVTGVLALFIDKKICRPLVDGYFKSQESKLEDLVIADLEKKFQAGAVAGLSSEAQAKFLNAVAEALKKQQ